MYLKNDLDLEIFYRKDPIFFYQKCFLDHTSILSEKKIEKEIVYRCSVTEVLHLAFDKQMNLLYITIMIYHLMLQTCLIVFAISKELHKFFNFL